jgi:tetratricopeptide (TPR) repeat protein
MWPALQACEALAAEGRLAAAILALREFLATAPGTPEAWVLLANTLMAAGQADDALATLAQAMQAVPDHARLYRIQKELLLAQGRLAEAYLAELACNALAARSAEEAFKLGSIYFFDRQSGLANRWYALAATLDLDATVYWHRNLSNDLWGKGQFEDARFHRDAAFCQKCVFIERAATPALTVLILCSGTRGDIPADALFDKSTHTLIKWVAEYAGADGINALPPFDVIFNAIGDADLHEALPAAAVQVLRDSGRPLLNPPERVAHTARTRIPGLLAGIAHVRVPPSARIPGVQLGEFAQHPSSVEFPLLLRPVGSHGGEFLTKLESPCGLGDISPLAEAYIATGYADYQSADGFYRKYRMIFVNRKPYPYHLAVSAHWMVHYESAGMYSSVWKREEENRFLAAPGRVLGGNAMEALKAIGCALDLDYCGIDFSLLPDGTLLVFEANPTMLVHFEPDDGRFELKNRCVEAIRVAFHARLAEVAGARGA